MISKLVVEVHNFGGFRHASVVRVRFRQKLVDDHGDGVDVDVVVLVSLMVQRVRWAVGWRSL